MVVAVAGLRLSGMAKRCLTIHEVDSPCLTTHEVDSPCRMIREGVRPPKVVAVEVALSGDHLRVTPILGTVHRRLCTLTRPLPRLILVWSRVLLREAHLQAPPLLTHRHRNMHPMGTPLREEARLLVRGTVVVVVVVEFQLVATKRTSLHTSLRTEDHRHERRTHRLGLSALHQEDHRLEDRPWVTLAALVADLVGLLVVVDVLVVAVVVDLVRVVLRQPTCPYTTSSSNSSIHLHNSTPNNSMDTQEALLPVDLGSSSSNNSKAITHKNDTVTLKRC